MNWVSTASIVGFLGVALGAFGAHGFKSRLEALGTSAHWQTAVLYHLVHAVALLACALFLRTTGEASSVLRFVPWGFLLGILIFSGSLYVLALSDLRILGAITPIGGVLLLLGWAGLAWSAR